LVCFFNSVFKGVSGKERERGKFITRQPPKEGKYDYDSENSWISNQEEMGVSI